MFSGIWSSQIKDFPDQRAILHLLAQADAPCSAAMLVEQSGFAAGRVQVALEALERRDLIGQTDGRWELLMPLFRQWLRLQQET